MASNHWLKLWHGEAWRAEKRRARKAAKAASSAAAQK